MKSFWKPGWRFLPIGVISILPIALAVSCGEDSPAPTPEVKVQDKDTDTGALNQLRVNAESIATCLHSLRQQAATK